jgi:hypothetical protein
MKNRMSLLDAETSWCASSVSEPVFSRLRIGTCQFSIPETVDQTASAECVVGWCELPVSFPGVTPIVSYAPKMRCGAVEVKQVNFVPLACVLLLPAYELILLNVFQKEKRSIGR